METLVLSAQDYPKDAWPKGSAPPMFALQGDDYSYCSHLGQTCSHLSDHMHAIGGSYMPTNILAWQPHSIIKQHVFAAASVIESETFGYNSIKYRTVPIQRFSAASCQQSCGTGHRSKQGCRLGQAVCGWTFAKARHHSISKQACCGYASSRLVGAKFLEEVFSMRSDELPVCRTMPVARTSSFELFTTESLPAYLLQQPKTSKHFAGRCGKEYPTTTQESGSLKDPEICGRGGVFTADEAHSKRNNRFANKAPQRDDKVGCNVPQAASAAPYQVLSVGENGTKENGNESLTGALLDMIKGAEEKESSSVTESQEIAVPCLLSPSLKKNTDKHDRGGLTPFDPIITARTPLAMKGHSEQGIQSVQSPCMEERWAGPAFSNSPPPSSLPVPSFARRRLRTSSLEIPGASSEFLPDLTCGSAPGIPSRSCSLPSIGAFQAHLGTANATQSLRRLLNLDVCA